MIGTGSSCNKLIYITFYLQEPENRTEFIVQVKKNQAGCGASALPPAVFGGAPRAGYCVGAKIKLDLVHLL